jgi:hypothetical protein
LETLGTPQGFSCRRIIPLQGKILV